MISVCFVHGCIPRTQNSAWHGVAWSYNTQLLNEYMSQDCEVLGRVFDAEGFACTWPRGKKELMMLKEERKGGEPQRE